MKRFLPILSSLALAGCMTPTWKTHAAGAPMADDHVLLVGSVMAIPPFNQEREGPVPICYSAAHGQPCGGTMLVGGQAGNLMGFFTTDLSEKMRTSVNRMPFDTFDWAWIPLEGAFVIEVPRRERIYLRGVQYYTKGDDGAVRFELPGHVDLRRNDRVIYVGEIHVVRTGERKITFEDRQADTRKALEAGGYGEVLATPWRKAVLVP